MPDLEELPPGTRFTDVLEAAQAAWLAKDYKLARELIQRYVDPNGEFCCMRCTAMREEPWRLNNHLGTFFVCPDCATSVTQSRELLEDGGELFGTGPAQMIARNRDYGTMRISQIVQTVETVRVVKK